MNKADHFKVCLAMAEAIVARNREDAPTGCDPQNSFAAVAGFFATYGTAITAGAAVVGAGAAVTGGIMQYKAGQAQARSASAMAAYNAHQQELNAKMQLMSMQAQASAQKRMAEAQFRIRQAEANARFANAKSIENTVEGQSRNTRESIRRKASEYERFQGTQRAAIAKSGLVESTGTPLDILAETASTIQLEREDSLYSDELNRRSLFREAELERLGGKLALAGATLDRSSEIAGAGLRSAQGQAEYRSGIRQANITRLTGAAQAQAYQGQSMGNLFSGVAQGAGALGSVNWKALT